jgi:hypothetical protein
MNRTPRPLQITGRDDARLALAPFERLEVARSKLLPFDLSHLLAAGVVDVVCRPSATSVKDARSPSAAPACRKRAIRWLRDLRGRTVDWFGNQFSLVLVILIGAGLPALVVFHARGVQATIGGKPLDAILASPADRRILVAYGLQWTLVAILSVAPALLYFLFDREQLGALSGRFVRQAFRFDPSLETMRDLEAKYGRQMREAFGSWNHARRTTHLPQGRRSPLVLATLLITIGWVATFLTPHLDVPARFRGPDAPADLLRLLTPSDSTITFGFLGAYFFTIQAVLRGYVRRDLQPKTYSGIVVHLVVVMILVWVIGVQDSKLSVLAFFVGILPETGLRYLRELLVSRKVVRHLMPSLYERAPLTDLEGIDLYDRSRLEVEGVTNVEALAHADIVELMLQTRIPVARLVDWVDQAILYLHVGLYQEVEQEGPAHQQLVRMRHHGIRTATDLLQAYDAAGKRDGDRGRRRLCVSLAGGSGEKGALAVQVIIDGLSDEEWLSNISHWRELSRRPEPVRNEQCLAPAPTEPDGAVTGNGAGLPKEIVLSNGYIERTWSAPTREPAGSPIGMKK